MVARGRRLRVALVVPRRPPFRGRPALARLRRESRRFRNSLLNAPLPNLALLTLAGHTPEGIEVRYLDENAGARPADWNCDIAAITALTCQAPRAYALAETFRRRGSHVVLGGPHATALPREAAKHADTVIRGEAELLWERFLGDFLDGRPARSYTMEAGKSDHRSRVALPRYDLLSPNRWGTVPLQVGRGCPLGCEFCSVATLYGKTYRHKEIDQVVEEAALIRRLWGGRPLRIFFADDNLHFRGRFMENLLEAVARLGVEWVAMADLRVGLSRHLVRSMAGAGCRRLLVGLEGIDWNGAGDPRGREAGGRSPGECGRLIREIRSAGIAVSGMFMVGRDHDRPEVFGKMKDFIADTGLDDVQVAIQTPLLGTRLYERLSRQRRILSPRDWSKFDFFNVVYRPKGITPIQLLRGQTGICRRVYG
jgi:radical SAM superfamily enzyme YgiQ (UPF0313 family)